jgi:hypothetical protein
MFGFALLPAMLLMKVFFALLALPALRLVYASYEAKKEWRPQSKSRASGAADPLGIPVARGESVAGSGGRRLDTAEVVQPPSITEPTTRLLKSSRGRE